MFNNVKESWDFAKSCEGTDKVLKVVLARKGEPTHFSMNDSEVPRNEDDVTETGVIVKVTDDGEVHLRNLYGQMRYCWPLLDCELVDAPF